MQLFNKYDTEKRTLYYWSKQYGGQLYEGQRYRQLNKCITINLLDYAFLPTTSYHSVFHLREDRTGVTLTDDIELHFLELAKIDQIDKPLTERSLLNWLLFLKGAEQSKWEVLAMNEPTLRKAMTTLEFLSQNEEARMLYEARQKYLHDEASLLDGALEEGRKIGYTQGHEQGHAQGHAQGQQQKAREVALRLLAAGVDKEIVAEASGLTLSEIEQLQ